MRSSCVAGALVLVVAAWLLPEPAHACSYGVGLDLVEPADGAMDVPTNVVPWLRGVASPDQIAPVEGTPSFGDGGVETPVVVKLEDEAGSDVPFELAVRSAFPYRVAVEVRPQASLSPRTTYTLAVYESGIRHAYSFTTGDGPVDVDPPALEPTMQVADRSYVDRSCDHNSHACVSVPDDTTVVAKVTADDGTVEGELIWGHVPRTSGMEWIRREMARESPFCVELRARAITGELGPPSTICSTSVRTLTLEEGEREIQCDGARIRTSSGYLDEASSGGGCSATAAGSSSAAWWALLALALFRRRSPG